MVKVAFFIVFSCDSVDDGEGEQKQLHGLQTTQFPGIMNLLDPSPDFILIDWLNNGYFLDISLFYLHFFADAAKTARIFVILALFACTL